MCPSGRRAPSCRSAAFTGFPPSWTGNWANWSSSPTFPAARISRFSTPRTPTSAFSKNAYMPRCGSRTPTRPCEPSAAPPRRRTTCTINCTTTARPSSRSTPPTASISTTSRPSTPTARSVRSSSWPRRCGILRTSSSPAAMATTTCASSGRWAWGRSRAGTPKRERWSTSPISNAAKPAFWPTDPSARWSKCGSKGGATEGARSR